jgi:hypothetical protein
MKITDTLYYQRKHLWVAEMRFKRDFEKTWLYKFMIWCIERLNNLLTKLS